MNDLLYNVLFIGKGIFLTTELLGLSLFLSMALGTLWALLKVYNIAVFPINGMISLLRGTPLILQLSFIYFSAPGILGVSPGIFVSGIIAFGLNSSAYFAEILRAGIEQFPKGQIEACSALKIPEFYKWKDIILPQVLKAIFPALLNECIALLKETALISTIGGIDLMRQSQIIAAEQFSYFLPLCITGVYYYLMVVLITYFGKKLEKRGVYASDI